MGWGGRRAGSGRKKALRYRHRLMIADIYYIKVLAIINNRTKARMDAAYAGTDQDDLIDDMSQLNPNWLYEGRRCTEVACEVADTGIFLECSHDNFDCICCRINDAAEAMVHRREAMETRPKMFLGRSVRGYKKEAMAQTVIEFELIYGFKPNTSQIEKALREFPQYKR